MAAEVFLISYYLFFCDCDDFFYYFFVRKTLNTPKTKGLVWIQFLSKYLHAIVIYLIVYLMGIICRICRFLFVNNRVNEEWAASAKTWQLIIEMKFFPAGVLPVGYVLYISTTTALSRHKPLNFVWLQPNYMLFIVCCLFLCSACQCTCCSPCPQSNLYRPKSRFIEGKSCLLCL